MSACPCGLKSHYSECCEPIHTKQTLPATAELLMRSRYSAYALRLVDYLLYSHHPRQHGKNEKEKVKQAAEGVDFFRLEILDTSQGQVNDKIGKVEFKAFYRHGTELGCIHENSRFKRYQGRWVYWDGELFESVSD